MPALTNQPLKTAPANSATIAEPLPQVTPILPEAFPANPNDPLGVKREIIEEIERIGRKYASPKE